MSDKYQYYKEIDAWIYKLDIQKFQKSEERLTGNIVGAGDGQGDS